MKKNEKITEIDEQGQNIQGQDLATSVHARLWNDLYRVSTAYVVISLERPPGIGGYL